MEISFERSGHPPVARDSHLVASAAALQAETEANGQPGQARHAVLDGENGTLMAVRQERPAQVQSEDSCTATGPAARRDTAGLPQRRVQKLHRECDICYRREIPYAFRGRLSRLSPDRRLAPDPGARRAFGTLPIRGSPTSPSACDTLEKSCSSRRIR